MSEKIDPKTGEKTSEKLLRFGRNINFLGAAAIGGVALAIPGPNVVLSAWAALNVAQGMGFEIWRQAAKNKRPLKPKQSNP